MDPENGPATVWLPAYPGIGEMSSPGISNITDTTGANITDTIGANITDTGQLFTQVPATTYVENDAD